MIINIVFGAVEFPLLYKIGNRLLCSERERLFTTETGRTFVLKILFIRWPSRNIYKFGILFISFPFSLLARSSQGEFLFLSKYLIPVSLDSSQRFVDNIFFLLEIRILFGAIVTNLPTYC